MLTFKQFKQAMDNIKNIGVASNKFNEALSGLGELNFFYFDKWEASLVELLRQAMKDEDDNIGYFIYEIEFGKDGKDCIEDDDGKHSLTTYKELYNYLIK